VNAGDFSAQRVSRTASITLNAAIGTVFPLFGPIEEMKWARGWNPVVLYSTSGTVEEGMTFRTPGHEGGESEYFWLVSRYQPVQFLVKYLVFTANRYWTIRIQCHVVSENRSSASVTYTYTGLNDFGNRLNGDAIEAMFRDNLADWEEEINHYLKTGSKLPA
jgi:hypothetical protein